MQKRVFTNYEPISPHHLWEAWLKGVFQMSVLGLLENNKYVSRFCYVEENVDDAIDKAFYDHMAQKTPKTTTAKKTKTANKKITIEQAIEQAQKKIIQWIVKLMFADSNIVHTFEDTSTAEALLTQYSIDDLIYMRRALKEYKVMNQIQAETDLFEINDKGQFVMKF
jgi:hypothetical protein